MPEYTDEQWEKITGPKASFLTDDETVSALSLPSGMRPRLYGLSPENQVVKITSLEILAKYSPIRVWQSFASVRDILPTVNK